MVDNGWYRDSIELSCAYVHSAQYVCELNIEHNLLYIDFMVFLSDNKRSYYRVLL